MTESGRPRGEGDGDFQRSVARLEHAVDELVSSTRTQVSDRAASLIDETTRRLQRELRRRGHNVGSDDDEAAEPTTRRSRRRRQRPTDDFDTFPRRLYRDPDRQRLAGVCAGIARYYGMEPWVVRCIAVTALLFFPTIVFPAYWIAYFIMDNPPSIDDPKPARRRKRQRRDHSSPAPELGPRLSPRNSLRNVHADLTDVELRLRRLETHVTSGQYELQRELHKIERDGNGSPA